MNRTPAAVDLLLHLDAAVELLERVNLNVLNVRVQLLLGLLVVVALACEAHADPVRDVPDPLGPYRLVEGGVHADVLGAHDLGRELPDLRDRARGLLLEGAVGKGVRAGGGGRYEGYGG